jgi:hypothetical protein
VFLVLRIDLAQCLTPADRLDNFNRKLEIICYLRIGIFMISYPYFHA